MVVLLRNELRDWFGIGLLKRSRNWAVLVLAYLAASLWCAHAVSAFWGSKPATTIEEFLGPKFAVKRTGDRTTIVYRPTAIWSEQTPIANTAMRLRLLGIWMKETGKWLKGTVYWRVVVPSVDKYGDKTTNHAFTLSIDMEEFRKINFKNMPEQQVLGFTKMKQLRPIARRGISEFCQAEAKWAERFCRQPTTR